MDNPQPWPLQVDLGLVGTAAIGAIEIGPGLNTLVGPNGAGKTRALRAIAGRLDTALNLGNSGRKMHLLAAGRSSPMENFRAAMNQPGYADNSDLAIGHSSYGSSWWRLESVTGILLSLDRRTDLRLKVEASLQQLFDRSLILTWSQQGLGKVCRNRRASCLAGS